jgi:hypothetical protein
VTIVTNAQPLFLPDPRKRIRRRVGISWVPIRVLVQLSPKAVSVSSDPTAMQFWEIRTVREDTFCIVCGGIQSTLSRFHERERHNDGMSSGLVA